VAAYCTLAELIDRYGERFLIDLSFRGETQPSEPDAQIFDRAIADAGALIDGYLKVRYALPLATVPDAVRAIAIAIAIYLAHAEVAPEKITADYKSALKLLEDISKGLSKLDVAGAEPAGSGGSGARITDRERPMTEDNLKSFI
jgi:phage gp36-like protein